MAANRENRREANSRIKGDMFIFFLKGLKDEIRTRMRYTGSDFDEAVDKAREIEIEMEALREEGGEEMNRILYANETHPVPSSQVLFANEKPARPNPPTCQFCSKVGHEASKCYSIVGRPDQGRPNFQPRPYQPHSFPFTHPPHVLPPFPPQFQPQYQPQYQQIATSRPYRLAPKMLRVPRNWTFPLALPSGTAGTAEYVRVPTIADKSYTPTK